MMRTKKEEEISKYHLLSLDLGNFYPSFAIKDEDLIYDDLSIALEEKLFYIDPIKIN